ncbi:Uncharacterized protein RP368 [Chlamydiales bacterium SCGC AG-110-P3]|nr:Uncharacterized protein RP368 [Chlamydiales bacterium SCGC AG-110-P3]
MIIDIIEQASVFIPFAFGVFISYRFLRIADLTVDGSYVLGAGTYAKCLLLGLHPILAVLLAMVAGALAGCGVAAIQRKGRIDPLIAGILALFILQSVNLMVMGRPNLNLLGLDTALAGMISPVLLVSTVALIVLAGLGLGLDTLFGLRLRAFGDNASLLGRQGCNIEAYRTAGLVLSNALVALAGCMAAEVHGYADVRMGTGMVLIAIGTVLIGAQLFTFLNGERRARTIVELVCCMGGVVLYFTVVNVLVGMGVEPVLLKMVMGLVLIGFLFSGAQRRQEAFA